MDENSTCAVCSSEYDVSNVVPKVLQCGHSFCLPCLIEIVQNTSVCPNCRHTISGDVDSLPTNYSVLGMIESYKSIKNLENHVACSIDIMKNKYLKSKEKHLSSLEVIDNGLEKLSELIYSDSQEIDTRKARKILSKLEEDFKKSEDFVRFDYWKLKLSPSLSLRSFENPEMYLSEIYNRLMNYENLYAVKEIGDATKYGKLSIYDNKLMLDSLSLTEAPLDSKLILFDDLKQCANLVKLHTFINIATTPNCDEILRIVFQLYNGYLSEIFIMACTGECGPSLKNCFYRKGDDISPSHESILHAESKCEAKKMSYSNCPIDGPTEIKSMNGESFLQMKPNGNLDIYSSKSAGVLPYFPHAKVITPGNLDYSMRFSDLKWFLKIVECGLLYSV